MAWYNSGNWEGVEVEKCATLLSQILYAINERQAAQGVTVTSWDSPVSTTYPTASNCVMAFSDCLNLLGDAQTAITNLCTTKNPGNVRFVESDYTTQYTLSNLLGDGSYGTSWLSLDRAQNAQIWLQIREALDLLVYIKSDLGATATYSSTDYFGTTAPSTQQAAWDNVLTSPTVTNSAIFRHFRLMTRSSSGPFYIARLWENCTITRTTYQSNGANVDGGRISFTYSVSTPSAIPGYILYGSDGSEISLTSNTSGTLTASLNWASGTITFLDERPSTAPFVDLGSGDYSARREIGTPVLVDNYVVNQLIPGTHLTYG